MLVVAIALLVVALTSALHGAVGFGMNLLAVPVLVLLDPAFVPGPAVAAGLVLAALVAARERRPVERRLGWAVLGLLPGTALALLVLSLVPADALTVLIGCLVLVAVLLSALRLHLTPTAPTLAGAGFASGFLSTAGSIGGPPLALVYADSSGPRLRSNISAFFVVTALVSLVALAATGHLDRHELGLAAALLPAVAVGFLASGPLRPLVDRGHVKSAVLGMSGVAGVVAILQGLLA